MLAAGLAFGEAPPNDSFDAAELLSGADTIVFGSNREATSEPNEPPHAGRFARHSVWWVWQAPDSGPTLIDMDGTFSGCVLAIYTGKYLDSLSVVASNIVTSEAITGKAIFNAEGGTRYQIAVDGPAGDQGDIRLRLRLFTATTPPEILQQPIGKVVTEGQPFSLSVSALGVEPLTYQWRLEGAALPGATQSVLQIAAALMKDAGDYQVVAATSGGSVTSHVASVSVIPLPPQITMQPQDVAVMEGQNATFSITASSSVPVQYRWRLGAIELTGQTNATLSLNNVRPSNAGEYDVAVSNSGGTTVSRRARLTVNTRPPNDDFANRIFLSGSSANATGSTRFATRQTDEPQHAGLTGTNSIWWSWTAPESGVAEVNLDGSYLGAVVGVYTGTSLSSLTPVTVVPTAGVDELRRLRFEVVANRVYQVAVDSGTTGVQGSVILQVAFLGSPGPPLITRQPQSLTVTEGTLAVLSLEATGYPSPRFQWQRNGADVPGDGTNSTLRLPDVQVNQAGDYRAIVSNASGAVTSQVATLTVVPRPPVIPSHQPADLERAEGERAVFAVTPSGSGPMWYQWKHDGVDLTGATDATLVLDPVTTNHFGNYQVLVSNSGGSSASRIARFTVHSRPINSWFTNRVVLTETNIVVTGYTNTYAITEPGEPVVPGLEGTNSVWFEWKSPGDGFGELGWGGSFGGAGVGVFVGESLEELEPVEVYEGGTNRIWFRTEIGVNYQIVINSTNLFEVGLIEFRLTYYPHGKPPDILQQPRDQEVLAGTTVQFNVTAFSQTDVAYEWRFNGVALPGGTNALLTVTGVQANQAGSYEVLVSNQGGSALSRIATLTVLSPPPNDNFVDRTFWSAGSEYAYGSNRYATREPGEPEHGGGGGMASVWWSWLAPATGIAVLDLNGSFSGAVAGIYTNFSVTSLQSIPTQRSTNPDGTMRVQFDVIAGGVYQVAVDGNVPGHQGAITLRITLSPLARPMIVLEPKDQAVVEGQTASFDVRTVSVAPVSYQWFFNGGTPLPGATNEWLVISGVRNPDAGTYQAVASNAAGSVTSRLAKLTVTPLPPRITIQPQSLAVLSGQAASFNVTATGVTPLSYQWLFNGAQLDRETNSSLTLGSALPNHVGFYQVTISNVGGVTWSQTASLTVNVRPPNDDFANRIAVTGTNMTVTRTTEFATRESGEPAHGGLGGTNSVWWSWLAGTGGVAELSLQGSVTGSVVGVYTNASLGSLVAVPLTTFTNLDGTTRVQFSVQAGRIYQIAVDGRNAGNQGRIILNIHTLLAPIITSQPQGQTVAIGEEAQFAVLASSALPVAYQWYRGNVSIPDATNAVLTLPITGLDQAGSYHVTVRNDAGTTASLPAPLTLASVITGQVTDAGTGLPLVGIVVSAGTVTNTTTLDGEYRLVGVLPEPPKADFDADRRSGPAPLAVQFFDRSTAGGAIVIASAEHYVTVTDIHVPVWQYHITTNHFTLTRNISPRSMRLVLNWGPEPADLDLHLYGPEMTSQPFHVSYKDRGDLTKFPFATLDVDRQDGYGPETVTITNFLDGKYHFLVHRYSGIGMLTESEAVARIYRGNMLLRTVPIPETGVGDLWHICEIDGSTLEVTLINRIAQGDPSADLVPLVDQPVQAAPGNGLAPQNLTGYSWSFGDGTGSLEREPQKTYSTPGSYTVRLEVMALDGSTAVETKTDYITVVAVVNSPPWISPVPNPTILEDSPPTTLAFTVSDLETPSELLSVFAHSWNDELLPNDRLSVGGSQSNRTLTFEPAPDHFGTGPLMLEVTDGEGHTTRRLVEVTVLPVNDAPSFTKGPDLTVNFNAGPQEFPEWARDIRAGPANESEQSLEFLVTTDRPALFTEPPRISKDGALTFTGASGQSGTVTVTAILKDDGGVEDGGVDTSAPQFFTITVVAMANQRPQLAPVPRKVVEQGEVVSFVVGASDPDVPPQALTYALAGDAPPMAQLDARTGLFIWTPETVGIHHFTVTVVDNGTPPLEDSQIVEVEVIPAFGVRLSQPLPFSVFEAHQHIEFVAEVSGTASRVEFWVGTELVGSDSSFPFALSWSPPLSNAEYYLRAVAYDSANRIARSDLVPVAVGANCGLLAILAKDWAESDLKVLDHVLFDLHMPSVVLDPSLLTTADLAGFGQVIWAQSDHAYLNEHDLDLLLHLKALGIPMMVAGEGLLSAASLLDFMTQQQWMELIQLRPADGQTCVNRITHDHIGWDIAVPERAAGDGREFDYHGFIEPAIASGLISQQVLSRAGGCDVALAYLDRASQWKSATINLSLSMELPPEADRERRRLVANLLGWLGCRVCHTLSLGVFSEPVIDPVFAGEEFEFTFTVSSTGECESLNVVAYVQVPAGTQDVEAFSTRGFAWVDEDGLAIGLGQMRSAERADVTVRARLMRPGMATFVYSGSAANAIANPFEMTVRVLGASVEAAIGPDGALEVMMRGEGGTQGVLEWSEDLRTWTPLATRPLIDGAATFREIDTMEARHRWYRGRMLP